MATIITLNVRYGLIGMDTARAAEETFINKVLNTVTNLLVTKK